MWLLMSPVVAKTDLEYCTAKVGKGSCQQQSQSVGKSSCYLPLRQLGCICQHYLALRPGQDQGGSGRGRIREYSLTDNHDNPV